MNVAIFHPALVTRGGSQKYALQTARLLREHGHRVLVTTLDYSIDGCYPEIAQGIEILCVNHINVGQTVGSRLKRRYRVLFNILLFTGLSLVIQLAKNIFYSRKLAREFAAYQKASQTNFDILYVHETGINHFPAMADVKSLYLFCYDTPDKLQEWEIQDIAYKSIYKAVARLLFRTVKRRDHLGLFRRVFVLDEIMRRQTQAYYQLESDSIRKVYGGIDSSIFKPGARGFLRKKYQLPSTSRIVSCVSRFVPYRRLQDPLEVFARMLGAHEDVYLYINAPAEDPEYFASLMAKYEALLWPKGRVIVETTPFKNELELVAALQDSELFIFPNFQQTWGNAVLEAMACGCCCLVSDSCGIVEIVKDRSNALVYGCGDLEALSGILHELLSTPNRVSKIGAEAAKHISLNFSWESWYRRHMDLFQE